MTLESILIVDDDAMFRTLHQLVLAECGITCQVTECSDGKAALEYFANPASNPQLVLLDLNMPVMGGLEFLEAYQKLGRTMHPAVFIVSGNDVPANKTKALSYPFVKGFIDKPLTSEAVALMLKQLQQPLTGN